MFTVADPGEEAFKGIDRPIQRLPVFQPQLTGGWTVTLEEMPTRI